ncbi:hypothetical protein V6N12_027396 [Hibiscus sabdariffa]|uniref:Uncharacterized protein n=1 Tax=Hibiscus sabdariffa TaxID=183260 RepID=A0ABR2DV54_9ROSI
MSTTNMFIVKELVKELEDTIVLDYLGDMAHELQQDLLESWVETVDIVDRANDGINMGMNIEEMEQVEAWILNKSNGTHIVIDMQKMPCLIKRRIRK